MEQPLYQSSGDAAPPPSENLTSVPEVTVSNSPPPPPPPISNISSAPSINNLVSPPPSSKTGKIFMFLGIGLAICLIAALVYSLITKSNPLKTQVVVTYWGLWEPETVMRNLIIEYEKTHPKVKIAYIQQNASEYRERLQTKLNQGQGPDIFRIHNTWVPMFRNYLQSVPADIYSASDFSTTFYPVANKDARLGANLVAIPLETDNLVMFTNDTLFSQYSLAIPKNWDELRLAALAIARCSTPEGKCFVGSRVLTAGVALGSTVNVDHWEEILGLLMLQNNVNLNNPALPQPQPAQDVINYFTSFTNQYGVWEPNLPTSTMLFASGKLGIMFAPSWRALDIMAANPDLKFSTHPVPQTPIDPTKQETPIAYATYWLEGVNSKSKSSAEAWAFLKFITSSENQQKLYSAIVAEKRPFGEPYSRVDLSGQIINAPYIGATIQQLPYSTSWYLASFTHDGPTGINTRLSEFYAKLIAGQEQMAGSGVVIAKILGDYGLAVGP